MKVWTVESMREVLQMRDDQVGMAVSKLVENKVEGAEELEEYAQEYKDTENLSTLHLVLARKKLTKYYSQLCQIANG